MEGASTSRKRRKEVRQRKESCTMSQLFIDPLSKCNAMQMTMGCLWYFLQTNTISNFNRSRVWPLNLLSLVGTPMAISEQYFHSDANCKQFFLFWEWHEGLVAFGHDKSLKTTLELLKQSLYLSKGTSVGRLDNELAIFEPYSRSRN